MSKSGPVYDVQWQPTAERFCVIHGYMPSNATIFRSPKLDAVFHYEGISKNTCLYSPGNSGLLALAGFGNLQGKVAIYQLDKKEMITEFEAANCTQFDWAADGQHFVSATTTPRLRIDNRFSVLDYTGKPKLTDNKNNTFIDVQHLFEVAFQPLPELSENASFNLTENQIKDLQKQTKKAEVKTAGKKFVPPAKRKEMQEAKAAGKTAPGQNPVKVIENKIKGLRKKLSSIKQLKSDPSKVLNDDQKGKIAKEKEFLAEMADLQKQLKALQT